MPEARGRSRSSVSRAGAEVQIEQMEVRLHRGTWKEQSGKACSLGASIPQALGAITGYPKKGKNNLSQCCSDKGACMTQANKSTMMVVPVAPLLEEAVASQRGLAAIILASLAADVLLSRISRLNPWY